MQSFQQRYERSASQTLYMPAHQNTNGSQFLGCTRSLMKMTRFFNRVFTNYHPL